MTNKVRLYRAWRAYRRRLSAATDALGSGFWLGVLDRKDLHRIDEALYVGTPAYRDDLHTLRGLFPWERAALQHFPEGGSLVVVGAGGGRELLALHRAGYEVTGYECNDALLRYGRDVLRRFEIRGATLHPLARDEAPQDGGPYDGVIVGWSAYMLIAGRERRVAFLRGLRALARPGAPLLISFFTRNEQNRRPRIVARLANAVRAARRRAPVEVGDDLVPNFVHRFIEAEIAEELRAGGFVLREFWPQGPGGHDSGWAVGVASEVWISSPPALEPALEHDRTV